VLVMERARTRGEIGEIREVGKEVELRYLMPILLIDQSGHTIDFLSSAF
jgi:hypothetical protein